MLFNSIDFIIFFPIVTLLYFIIPDRAKNYFLLAASYFFYMCWNPKYILLLMASTLVTFLSGIVMERVKQSDRDEAGKTSLKKWTVAVSFILNIGLLFYFKYINFALELITDILAVVGITVSIPAFDIVLPVGISFYIFQALSYTVDVYRDDIYAEKNIFRYALFVSFFPQLVAGPIERSKNLLVQLATPKRFNYDNVRNGLLIMLWGYFIKIVLADRVAILVDTVYASYDSYTGMALVLANIGFTLQIYCDFMGYSTIAVGSARVLGYNLMSNFEMPYLATSIKDFWRRWHISLSSWFRDYLYIPLGGNRRGTARKWLNLMIVFLVSGLWHGANITFVVWGGIHGVYQVIEDAFKLCFGKISDRIHNPIASAAWKGINIVKTFICAAVAWIFFRAESVEQAINIFKSSLHLGNWHEVLFEGGIYGLGIDKMGWNILSIALLLLVIVSIMKENKINVLEWISARNFVVRYACYWLVVTLIIFSLDITGQEFIYFQF